MNDAHQPKDDGRTHLNVYSRAASRLGRALSNFSNLSFVHPIHGPFESVEGYWYYASTGFQHDDLRHVSGIQAKQLGRSYSKVMIDEATFQHQIRIALDARFIAHPWLRVELALSTLPLTHYYYWGNIYNPKVVTPSAHWVIEHLEHSRDRFRLNMTDKERYQLNLAD